MVCIAEFAFPDAILLKKRSACILKIEELEEKKGQDIKQKSCCNCKQGRNTNTNTRGAEIPKQMNTYYFLNANAICFYIVMLLELRNKRFWK